MKIAVIAGLLKLNIVRGILVLCAIVITFLSSLFMINDTMSASSIRKYPLAYSFLILACFSALPVFDFLNVNAQEVSFLYPARAVHYFLFLFIAVSAVFTLTTFFVDKLNYVFSAQIIGCGLFLFSLLGAIHDLFSSYLHPFLGLNPRFTFTCMVLIVIVPLLAFILYRLRKSENFLFTFSIALVSMLVSSALMTTKVLLDAQSEFNEVVFKPTATKTTSVKIDRKNLPNIYLLIPDEMSGPEILKSSYNIDSSDFLNYLASSGFHYNKKAKTNFPRTVLSMPQLLNMDYTVKEGQKISNADFIRFEKLIRSRENPVQSKLRSMGYRIYNVSDGFGSRLCRGQEDECLRVPKSSILHKQDYKFAIKFSLLHFLHLFKIEQIAGKHISKFAYPRGAELTEIAEIIPKPTTKHPNFVYAHFYLPHEPFRYKSDCSYRTKRLNGSVDDSRQAYADQVECSFLMLEKLVASIIKNDPNALIVLQSDEGGAFPDLSAYSFENLTAELVEPQMSIMSAYRLPEHCQSMIPDRVSSVNTFRIVFACLENRKPELLPNLSFVMNYKENIPHVWKKQHAKR